jgi:hypothetical protein
MQFNSDLHQKVRYAGQLYVVIMEEFPAFNHADGKYEAVLHPVSNDWIVHIVSPTVRDLLKVKKEDCEIVEHEIMA